MVDQVRASEVARQCVKRLCQVSVPEDLAWVQIEDPKQHNEHTARDRQKRPRLEPHPRFRNPAVGLESVFVEQHQRHRI